MIVPVTEERGFRHGCSRSVDFYRVHSRLWETSRVCAGAPGYGGSDRVVCREYE